jgi:hypothetical protein
MDDDDIMGKGFVTEDGLIATCFLLFSSVCYALVRVRQTRTTPIARLSIQKRPITHSLTPIIVLTGRQERTNSLSSNLTCPSSINTGFDSEPLESRFRLDQGSCLEVGLF